MKIGRGASLNLYAPPPQPWQQFDSAVIQALTKNRSKFHELSTENSPFRSEEVSLWYASFNENVALCLVAVYS